jgi:hypothetical protein
MGLLKKLLKRIRNERGVSLLEAAVAVMLLAGVVTTMILSLSSGALAVGLDDQEVTAQGLARTQIEYTKEYTYNTTAESYPSIDTPFDYVVTVSVDAVPDTNNNIQKITADVIRNGETILTLQDYKVNR